MMVMRMVSLGFDLEPTFAKDGVKRPPKVPALPSFMEYLGYCLFPSTSVFGPFLVFSEHIRFLDPSPIVSTSCNADLMQIFYDAGHLCSDIGYRSCTVSASYCVQNPQYAVKSVLLNFAE